MSKVPFALRLAPIPGLLLLAGCSFLRGEGRPLDPEELAGTDRILAVTRMWGDQDARVRPVAAALDRVAPSNTQTADASGLIPAAVGEPSE